MQRVLVIGRGSTHTLETPLYRALFEKVGLDWHCESKELASAEEVHKLLAGSDWLAAHMGAPYNDLFPEVATITAASVKLSGGANMLFRKNTQVVALNTVGLACVRSLQREGTNFAGAKVVVQGAGPTALAILAAAAQAGAARVALIGFDRDQTKEELNAFIARYKELAYATMDLEPAQAGDRSFRAAYEEPTYAYGSLTTSTTEIATADIVIDATEAQKEPGVVLAQVVENASVLLSAHEVENPFSTEELFSFMSEVALPC